MLLVLDTCFNACSAALFDDAAGTVVASGYEEMERGHAEALGPMVQKLFEDAEIKPNQLSRIVVTYGPGTFTGLRIGLSFAKGMALALDIPLIGIDSLTATVAPYCDDRKIYVVAHQAGGTGLFYWAYFEGYTSTQPALASAADIAAAVGCEIEGLTGSGLDRLALQIPLSKVSPAFPDAKAFAARAAKLIVSPNTVEPLYLRPPDAKPSVLGDAAKAHVRLATVVDFSAMANIHAASFAKGWSVTDLTDLLSNPGAFALVVELAGTIYGFVQFQWVAGEAEINTLCVAPNYRRQHFGRDLMNGLCSQLSMLKTTRVFLEVAGHNTAALTFYDGYGFQRHGLRRAYYSDGSDAVTMVKVLSP
jgi:tRNA threonylcarbamoyl adenosine modification protein YeaZ/ribosomal-protein-alanine acetyltransferase